MREYQGKSFLMFGSFKCCSRAVPPPALQSVRYKMNVWVDRCPEEFFYAVQVDMRGKQRTLVFVMKESDVMKHG